MVYGLLYICSVENNDDFQWLFTTVYGPVKSNKRASFLQEINNIYNLGYEAWIIAGDFNMLRKRSDRKGKSFDFVVSSRFQKLINDLQL